jgi:hypothetical protein
MGAGRVGVEGLGLFGCAGGDVDDVSVVQDVWLWSRAGPGFDVCFGGHGCGCGCVTCVTCVLLRRVAGLEMLVASRSVICWKAVYTIGKEEL